MGYTDKNILPPRPLHVLGIINSHKGSGSCAILPYLNHGAGEVLLIQYLLLFSLLLLILFLVLLFDRFTIFYCSLFCPTEGRKIKRRLSVINSGKRQNVRRCSDDSKKAKY